MSTSFENTVSPSHCNVLLTTYQSHFGLLFSALANMLHCAAEWVAKHERNPLTFKLNCCLSTMKSCRKRLHFNIIVIFFEKMEIVVKLYHLPFYRHWTSRYTYIERRHILFVMFKIFVKIC